MVNNIQNGTSTEYYENGQIKQTGQYKAGEKSGKWLAYDEAGNLIKTVNYDKGKAK